MVVWCECFGVPICWLIMIDSIFSKSLVGPEMLCAALSPMAETTDNELKHFVRHIAKCNYLHVPDTWACTAW